MSMNSLKKAIKYLTNPDYRFIVKSNRGIYDSMGDREYLERKFEAEMGSSLDLDNPISFNQKLQWLKLYDRNPEYTMMVDKYAVRNYIAEQLGEEYLIPLLGVWDSPDEIDFDKLPNQFVLKCNHNSGLGMCICEDKSKLDIKKTIAELNKGLKQDYYLASREWPYKDVCRKIIAEKYMVNSNLVKPNDAGINEGLNDYKFMCFNGIVKCSFVSSDRFSNNGLKVTFFDRDWNVMPFERHYPISDEPIAKPLNYEKMIDFAEKLAKNISFVRVDFYEIDGKLYFGEITFFPGSGMEEFTPEKADFDLGNWISLPNQ